MGLGSALIAGTAGRKKLAVIRDDFRKPKARERSSSRVDWANPPTAQVRTKNSSVGMQGALRASEEAQAQAGDWAAMEAKARGALNRNKWATARAADRRRMEASL